MYLKSTACDKLVMPTTFAQCQRTYLWTDRSVAAYVQQAALRVRQLPAHPGWSRRSLEEPAPRRDARLRYNSTMLTSRFSKGAEKAVAQRLGLVRKRLFGESPSETVALQTMAIIPESNWKPDLWLRSANIAPRSFPEPCSTASRGFHPPPAEGCEFHFRGGPPVRGSSRA